ncbi:ABC transporter permease [Candidatus Saccharibacteria bacterium]|nr:ABC transporter permease [Candidatus Saccharibacteria bacterium]
MKLSNILSRQNRILLRELVITDFKLRYQGSVLGYIWSLLKPLMLFAIMFVVFVHFMRFGAGIPHFAISLLLGLVLWTFFNESTNQGMQAIVNRGDLIRKINFPKYIIVISGTISALINLGLNLLVVFVFMMFDGVQIGWSFLLFPVTLVIIYAFSLGLAFFLAAAYVKYRDISHLWEVFLQGLFYATPIIYPLQMVIDKGGDFAAQILMLSPIAVLFQQARADVLGHEYMITASQLSDNIFYLAFPYVVVASVIVLAIFYFKKNQKYFAERV